MIIILHLKRRATTKTWRQLFNDLQKQNEKKSEMQVPLFKVKQTQMHQMKKKKKNETFA